ncbi:MAG: bacillithiol system redox-active protein YtxJ [Bacteroidota bacterium]
MKWNLLTDIAQLDTIDRESATRKVMIFKHSTRCSTSSTVRARIERTWQQENDELLSAYFLDLIQYRQLSNQIAERYKVEHESPQVLIISKGKCIYSETHLSISMTEVMKAVIA